MQAEAPPNWDKQQIRRQASFLQSALWGEFQKSIGHRPHFIMEKNWSCLLLERQAPIGRYLLAPYGPTLSSPEDLPAAIEGLKVYGRQLAADWLRLEPLYQWGGGERITPMLSQAAAVRARHNVEPALTRILDLSAPSDQILSSISATNRSLIRRNDRERSVTFRTSSDPADIPDFTAMVGTVADRKGVVFFSTDYYQKQAELLMPAKELFLELAYIGGQPVGGIIMHDFGENTSYTHAASLPQARDSNVSALLLWQALLNAKQRGCRQMDLYGVAPEDAAPSHPWYGFSAFKRKFGGRIVERAGTWDVPLSPKYKLYRAGLQARSLLRRT